MADEALSPRRRRPVSWRVVFAGLVVSFVLAGGIALWIYARYVAYERIASRHVLATAAAVVRIDLEKVVTYDPFRRHLLPLVKRGRPDTKLKPRLERLRHHTRVELGVDIRELVYAVGRKPEHWSLSLGGVFPSSGVPGGVHRVLEEEGVSNEFTVNQLSWPSGARMTQGADGVLVFASDQPSLASAAAPGERSRELGLPDTGPVALSLDGSALGDAARQALGRRLGLDVGGLRVRAHVVAENPMRCEVQVDPARTRPTPGDLKKAIQRLTGLTPSEIQSREAPDGGIRLAFPISSRHLDEAAGALAGWLAAQLSLPRE